MHMKESDANELLWMQDKEQIAQNRTLYEHTRGREHRSDAVLRLSSSIWADSKLVLHNIVLVEHEHDQQVQESVT